MPKGKVITTLRDRPAIEQALGALARARTEAETAGPLKTLRRYGPAVLPVVVGLLHTPDPWLVRALGRTLAQLPDGRPAAEALRRAILDPASSDRRRIVAMVLLDQFLGQPLDENLFSALGSPTEVAVNALLQDLPDAERPTRLDYLSIIHVQQPADIHQALERLAADGSDPAVEALAFFVLDERDDIAAAAAEHLGKIRRPAALHALRCAAPNVPAARRPAVERLQRKLLLSGVPDTPLPEPPAGVRLLVSTVDGAGNRLVILAVPRKVGWRGLHLFLEDAQGVRGAYELEYGPDELPPPAPTGTVHPAPHPWEGILMLESTLGYVRRLLRQALLRNEEEGENWIPVEYRFFCGQVWGWAAPPDEPPPVPEDGVGDWPQAVVALLSTPFMVSWFLESEGIYRAATRLLAVDLARRMDEERGGRAMRELLAAECPPELCDRYVDRLRDMAEWLLRAGETHSAAVAQSAAAEIERLGAESIFVRAMLQKGVLLALSALRQK